MLRGAIAGLAAGVVVAVLMSVMTLISPDGNFIRVITLLAKIVRSDSFLVGWLVHLMASAVIGAIFGGLFGGRASHPGSAAAYGAMYGIAWRVVGWLGLMPLAWGLKPFALVLTESLVQIAIAGLLGCLGYGAVLGTIFAELVRRPPASAQREPFRRAA